MSRSCTYRAASERISRADHCLESVSKVRIIVIALIALFASAAYAETRYVTDQFRITLRSGESATHRIIRMLPTGTPIRVLKDNPTSGYTHVRTPDGKEGYVLTRQLLKEPIARDKLEELNERVRELEQAPGQLSARLSSLQKEHAELKRAHDETLTVKRETEQELATLQRTAANAIRIGKERNELRKRVAALTRQLEELKQQNRELQNSNDQRWFLIGGGVVVGGILLGLILPRLKVRKRRDSWGSL